MAEPVVSYLISKLGDLFAEEIAKGVRKVVGVTKTVESLESTLERLRALLADAERRQVRDQAVRLWLMRLKDVAYDLEDVLDDWSITHHHHAAQTEGPKSKGKGSSSTLLLSCIPGPCSCFKQVKSRYGVAQRLEDIKKRLDEICDDKEKFSFRVVTVDNVGKPLSFGNPEFERFRTTSFDSDESSVFGRDSEKAALVEKLCEISTTEKGGIIEVVAVVGMGGLGKTTLAQMVFNNAHVATYFCHKIWFCVSDPFDEVAIACAIIKSLTGVTPDSKELQHLLSEIATSITGQKFLLVLDDVWTEDERKWAPLRNALNHGAAKGSAILVTTRKHEVADKMGATFKLSPKLLSDEESWSIFSHRAFLGKEMGNKQAYKGAIVEKCKGLPLAAQILGGLLRFKETLEEWENVLGSDLWQVEEARNHLLPSLLVSYYDLSPELRLCFAYCAIFPKDYKIEKDMLIGLWAAEGLLDSRQDMEMEVAGELYFNVLLMRSLFIDVEKVDVRRLRITFRMHDIVHDFAQFLSENNSLNLDVHSPVGPKSISSACRMVRHVSFSTGGKDVSVPSSIHHMKGSPVDISRSRAFLVVGWHIKLDESLCHFMYLRALVARHNKLERIPDEIGKLLNLRLLDLSDCQFLKELPETLCNLYNLQILNLRECSELRRLPEGIGNLASLRHVMIDETCRLVALPKGISRLTNLRGLTKFFVTRYDNNQGSNVGVLRNFSHIRGLINIGGVGLVSNGAEAEMAKLKNKRHILRLQLDFDPSNYPGCETQEISRHFSVLTGLEAPPALEYLRIRDYKGLRFPDWIGSLDNLKFLILRDCHNCELLPPLGELPYLKYLQLRGFPVLEEVGVEFLTNKVGATPFTAFRKLQDLTIIDMPAWKEWRGPVFGPNEREKLNDFTIFPCLKGLTIRGCPELKSLPHFLHRLDIQEVRDGGCFFI